MTKQICTNANVLRSGAVSVSYSVGRVMGCVMFDEKGRVSDATRQTRSSADRGFCGVEQLPDGVLAAARSCRAASVQAQ